MDTIHHLVGGQSVPGTSGRTSPVFDPATGGVINTEGSVNDLHGITLDKLTTKGKRLTVRLTNLTGDDILKGPRVATNASGALVLDALQGAGYPAE